MPFDLRSCPLDEEIYDKLFDVFPDAHGISWDGSFLHVGLPTLPSKPWPLTIAGVTLFFETEPTMGPFPRGRRVHSRNGSIADDLAGRDMVDWNPLFLAIKHHFQSIQVALTEVIYIRDAVYIVLEDEKTDTNIIPSRAGQIVCLYVFEKDMDRPATLKARRQHEPATGSPDHSVYSRLQPGLRISSGNLPNTPTQFLGTTTGVLVQAESGNLYMTVAAHGFPEEAGVIVHHALPHSGRQIGQLEAKLLPTDVGLVKLDEWEEFSNSTFDSDEFPSVPLRQLVSGRCLQRFTIVSLDSPDTGRIEGCLVHTSKRAVPSDDPLTSQEWIETDGVWLGQGGNADLPDEVYGTPIWTETGDVLGFFRYAPAQDGWCIGTSVAGLIEGGYTLADTTTRAQSGSEVIEL